MNWRIIGSVALYHWFPDARVPRDLDLLTPAKISGNLSTVCVVDAQWHAVAQRLIDENVDPVFLDADLLFTLKVSHAEWNVKWEKTMFDIQFLKSKGCKLRLDLLPELKKVWQEIHGKKHVNMAKSMDVFFNDAVMREYDHEHLHELVKFNDRPIHEHIRHNAETAWCSEELFNKLARFHQEECALEEIMVTAIERNRLTSTSKNSEKRIAMSKAYFQLVTSMTTGWFARFLILNRNELLFEGKDRWMTILNSALTNLNSSQQLTQKPG